MSEQNRIPPAPGDEAAPGTPGTGEIPCPECHGSGRITNRECPTCGGTGKVVRAIGGA
jgi:RecJ-like exonuclease